MKEEKQTFQEQVIDTLHSTLRELDINLITLVHTLHCLPDYTGTDHHWHVTWCRGEDGGGREGEGGGGREGGRVPTYHTH